LSGIILVIRVRASSWEKRSPSMLLPASRVENEKQTSSAAPIRKILDLGPLCEKPLFKKAGDARHESQPFSQLRLGKGILKVARECGVGCGTVQRTKQEIKGPFASAWPHEGVGAQMKLSSIIEAGAAEQVKWDDNTWIILDVGFGQNESSGLLMPCAVPRCSTFEGAKQLIVEHIKNSRPCGANQTIGLRERIM
jgi:hypothetical protein